MDTSCFSDDEFIDVENYSDHEEIPKNTVKKFNSSMDKYEITNGFIDVENDSDHDEFPKNIVNKVNSSMDKYGITNGFNIKLKTSPRNDNTTSNSPDELNNILLGIMNKIFCARVVLKRLPNAVLKKMKSTEKQEKEEEEIKEKNTRNNKNKTMTRCEKHFINEDTAYKRVCPKCRKPPAIRKTKQCLNCKINLIYECRKCHKNYPLKKYSQLITHLRSKCYFRGYYQCSACDYKNFASSKIKSHVKRLHPSVDFSKVTFTWIDLKNLPQSFVHKCSQCGKQFENHEYLNRHVSLCFKSQKIIGAINNGQQIRMDKDFQKMIIRFCPKCQKDTKVHGGGVSSLLPCQSCESTMKFKCLRCSKQYDSYSSIHNHTRLFCGTLRKQKLHPRYTSKETIDCPHCKKPFVQETWLKRHLLRCPALNRNPEPRPRLHYKHLKATCPNCDEMKNICDRRKFCRKCKSNLRFQCKTCDTHFTADYDSWCEHLKMFFDLIKYECNDCSAGLISKDALLKHLRTCHEVLQCDICNFKTKSKRSIRKHILFKHTILNA